MYNKKEKYVKNMPIYVNNPPKIKLKLAWKKTTWVWRWDQGDDHAMKLVEHMDKLVYKGNI